MSHTRLFQDVRLHIWSGDYNAVPGRTDRTPIPETSIQLPPITSVCAGSDDGVGDRQAPGGGDPPGWWRHYGVPASSRTTLRDDEHGTQDAPPPRTESPVGHGHVRRCPLPPTATPKTPRPGNTSRNLPTPHTTTVLHFRLEHGDTGAVVSSSYAPSNRAARYPTNSPSGTRSCTIVSRSRTVTASSLSDSKSMVIQNGVPISSCRRYRRPIAPASSKSTFQLARRDVATSRASGESFSLRLNGNTAAFAGASRGSSRRTVRTSISPLALGTSSTQ